MTGDRSPGERRYGEQTLYGTVMPDCDQAPVRPRQVLPDGHCESQ